LRREVEAERSARADAGGGASANIVEQFLYENQKSVLYVYPIAGSNPRLGDARRRGVTKTGACHHNLLKNKAVGAQVQAISDLDFVALGLDFVAFGLAFVAPDLDFVAADLVFIARESAGSRVARSTGAKG
jgi:hypothetical protein